MSKQIKIPEGYRQDARGRLVPEAAIKPIDLERDALILGCVAQAKEHSGVLKTFKTAVLDQVDAFVEASAAKYGAKLGGKKGNLTFTSFDGRYRVVVSIQDTLIFDERLQAAKSLVDECIRTWTEGSRPELTALINDAFQVDKVGNVSAAKILGLRRLEITEKKWKKAMEAISDSVGVLSSKRYARFYERNEETGDYLPISLDLAGA